MATTSIWKIGARLDQVLNYANDEQKNSEDLQFISLEDAISYATNVDKTEKQFYVSGINCLSDTTYKEMMITKKHFKSTKGIQGHHAYQSFVQGEVTPNQAHQIGIQLANEIWGDRFEVLVSTHLNTKCIHNHFVVNSVSFIDGKKYHNNRENYAVLRHTSDHICSEHNLSVLKEKPCGKNNIDYTKYYNKHIGKSNYYITTKEDINFAILQAYSYKDFESILKKMGYELTYRAGKLSIRGSEYKRNIRIQRSFGEEYSIDNIQKRITQEYMTRLPFLEVYRESKRYILKSNPTIKNKTKATGIYALYLYYCYLLKIFKKGKSNTRPSPNIRADIKKMESISNEAKFLNSNNIKTVLELSSCKDNLLITVNKLIRRKDVLYKKRRKAKTVDEIKQLNEELINIKNQISSLKKEIDMCENIKGRIPKIKKNIQETDKNKEKEMIKNEHTR